MAASPALDPPGSTTGWLSGPPAPARTRPAARSSAQVAGGPSPSASRAARRYHMPATSASEWTANVRPWLRPVSISGVRKSCSYSPLTQLSSSSSSGARNPESVNSGTQTESSTARSGPSPSATAWVRAWWSSCSSTVATLNLVSAGAARRISPSQGPSGTITRSSGPPRCPCSQCGFTNVPRRRCRMTTPSPASSDSARVTGVRLIACRSHSWCSVGSRPSGP